MDEGVTRTLLLTGLEVVFLVDGISDTDLIDSASNSEQADAKVPLARTALLALASAYIEVVDFGAVPPAIKPGPVTLAVTEEQAWLFRTKVRTNTLAIDKSPIGPGLVCKLLDLLLCFRYADDQLNLAEAAEPGLCIDPAVVKQQLEERNARINADPYEDYGPHNGAQPLPSRPGASVPSPEGKGDKDDSAVSAGLDDVDY